MNAECLYHKLIEEAPETLLHVLLWSLKNKNIVFLHSLFSPVVINRPEREAIKNTAYLFQGQRSLDLKLQNYGQVLSAKRFLEFS